MLDSIIFNIQYLLNKPDESTFSIQNILESKNYPPIYSNIFDIVQYQLNSDNAKMPPDLYPNAYTIS